MGKEREAKIVAGIGKKAVGKTLRTLMSILHHVKSHPTKALLTDVNDEFGRVDFPNIKRSVRIKSLAIKDVPLFARQTVCEVRRVRFFNEDGTPMSLDEIADAIYYILRNYKDGIILLEDPLRYMSSPRRDLLGMIATNRHRNLDSYLNYQYWRPVLNPKIWGNLNQIRLHKTIDSVEKYKYDIGDQYELLRVAESIVNLKTKTDPRAYVYIDLDESKISGDFTEEEFMMGVDDYLSNDYRKAVRPTTERRDNAGKRMFNGETAYRVVRQNLYDLYWGNSI